MSWHHYVKGPDGLFRPDIDPPAERDERTWSAADTEALGMVRGRAKVEDLGEVDAWLDAEGNFALIDVPASTAE